MKKQYQKIDILLIKLLADDIMNGSGESEEYDDKGISIQLPRVSLGG